MATAGGWLTLGANLAVPVAGDAAKALIKAGRKVANEVGEEAAERAAREGAAQVNEQFTQASVDRQVEGELRRVNASVLA